MQQLIQIDSDTAKLADDSRRPFVIFGSPFTAEVVLRDGTSTVVPPDGVYTFGVDDDFNFRSDELMVFAQATASTAGLIIHADTLTSKYASVINGRPAKTCYWQINRITNGTPTIIAQDWLNARGAVLPIDGTATELHPIIEEARAAAASAENSATASMAAATAAYSASTVAEAAAARAEDAAASISLPTPTAADNGKVITVSGGTYTLSKALTPTSVTIGESSWTSAGLDLHGSVSIWGAGMIPATLSSTTLNIGTVTNGTYSIPFSIPITATTATLLTLEGDQAYVWDLIGRTSTSTIEVNSLIYMGVEKLWAIDINLGASASVQYGLSFDSAGSDALTASKVNRCIVRFDGTIARLYCYATEDIA